jgi:hypothetical protein
MKSQFEQEYTQASTKIPHQESRTTFDDFDFSKLSRRNLLELAVKRVDQDQPIRALIINLALFKKDKTLINHKLSVPSQIQE